MVLMSALADRAEGWADPDSGDPHPLTGATLAAAELAPALRLSPVTAGIRVERAARIRDRLPATLAAYARGELDAGRVYAIDDATRHLDDEQAPGWSGSSCGRRSTRPPPSCGPRCAKPCWSWTRRCRDPPQGRGEGPVGHPLRPRRRDGRDRGGAVRGRLRRDLRPDRRDRPPHQDPRGHPQHRRPPLRRARAPAARPRPPPRTRGHHPTTAPTTAGLGPATTGPHRPRHHPRTRRPPSRPTPSRPAGAEPLGPSTVPPARPRRRVPCRSSRSIWTSGSRPSPPARSPACTSGRPGPSGSASSPPSRSPR